MPEAFVSSDVALLDLLRKREAMSIADLASVMQVTATAVRQRLMRLMAQGYVERTTSRSSRGRPGHAYALTAQGRRKTGSNFADLAVALWHEIRAVEDPEVRRGLLARISRRLVESYADRIEGNTTAERMASLAALFAQREIPFDVSMEKQLPVLTAHACPYPELAEQDRSICAMERMMFSELLGEDVRLSQCRLNGDHCCTFETRKAVPA